MNSKFYNRKYKLTIKHLTMLALLVAICSVGRMAFTWIPNFTPVTTLFLLICLNVGTVDAIIVANLTMLATALYLGMGYWVFGQMLAYSLVLILFSLLIRLGLFKNFIILVGIAFISSMAYGFIISWFMVFTLNFGVFWAYYSVGISYDLMHGFGSAVFMLMLYFPFKSFKLYIQKALV